MWTTLIVAVLSLSAPDSAAFGSPAPPSWSRTRPLNPGSSTLLALATRKSSIIRELLWRLEQTDVIVYLTDSMPGVMSGPRSYLAFVSRDLTARYLIIRIDRWRLSAQERIALLGHELQHALEVASAPEVKDGETMADLYRKIGWEGQRNKFETEAAQTIGQRVRSQLVGQRL